MNTFQIAFLTLFIIGVYDISGYRTKLIKHYQNNNLFLEKLFKCLFCYTFWVSSILTLNNWIFFPAKTDLLDPIYISGLMYLIIKVRWK